MPKPRKDDHDVRLSTYYTEIARMISESQNTAFAEVLTKACERGLDEMLEKYTKRLTVEKLQRRLRGELLPDDKET